MVQDLVQAEVRDVRHHDPEVRGPRRPGCCRRRPRTRHGEAARGGVHGLGWRPAQLVRSASASGPARPLVVLGLGHDDLGADLAEDAALDFQRLPGVVGHQDAGAHRRRSYAIYDAAQIASSTRGPAAADTPEVRLPSLSLSTRFFAALIVLLAALGGAVVVAVHGLGRVQDANTLVYSDTFLTEEATSNLAVQLSRAEVAAVKVTLARTPEDAAVRRTELNRLVIPDVETAITRVEQLHAGDDPDELREIHRSAPPGTASWPRPGAASWPPAWPRRRAERRP